MAPDLLKVEDLTIDFWTEEGTLKAVRGINFSLGKREVLGIVGESGCGKSVTALSILRLIPAPPGRIREEEYSTRAGTSWTSKAPEIRKVRGGRVSMVFRNP